MSKALVTFAVNGYQPLLDVALPRFQDYADRHGYDLFTNAPANPEARPASWLKLAAADILLDRGYRQVLWVDCDVIVHQDAPDVAVSVPNASWHAVTLHRTREGSVPSCGVWLLRRPMMVVLERMWRMVEYLHHPWWEQAALQHMLGYDPTVRPVQQVETTSLSQRTHWLAPEWHTLSLQYPNVPQVPPEDAWFIHAAPGSSLDYRLQHMHELLAVTARKEHDHAQQVPA